MKPEWPPLDKAVEEILDEARLHAGQGFTGAVGVEQILLALLSREPLRVALGLSQTDARLARDALLEHLGRTLLDRLLDIYAKRLQEKAIRLRYVTGVVTWLMERAGWRELPNPLHTLKLHGETHVADRLMELLLAKTIVPGQEVEVRVDGVGDSAGLVFSVGD